MELTSRQDLRDIPTSFSGSSFWSLGTRYIFREFVCRAQWAASTGTRVIVTQLSTLIHLVLLNDQNMLNLMLNFFVFFFLLKRFNLALMFPIKLEIIYLILIVAFETCHGILCKKISVLVKLFSSIFCLKGLDEAEGLTENGLTQHWEKEGRIEKNIKRFVCSIRGFRCRLDVEPEQKRKKNSQRNGSRTDLSKMADLASERVL